MRNQVQVVSEGDSGAGGNSEDLVFDIAVECDIGGGRGRLQGRQRIGVKRPLTPLVAKDELPALVCGGVDDHERSEHIFASGSVFMSLEEGVFACEP